MIPYNHGDLPAHTTCLSGTALVIIGDWQSTSPDAREIYLLSEAWEIQEMFSALEQRIQSSGLSPFTLALESRGRRGIHDMLRLS
eukprot:6175931-Pleurochrysis_carterae.AAC.1